MLEVHNHDLLVVYKTMSIYNVADEDAVAHDHNGKGDDDDNGEGDDGDEDENDGHKMTSSPTEKYPCSTGQPIIAQLCHSRLLPHAQDSETLTNTYEAHLCT